MKNVLVVATHPDDEALGCGGTLLKHKASGDVINWLIITKMDAEQGWSAERIKEREGEIEKVSSLFDFDKVVQLGYPTTAIDQIDQNDLVATIGNALEEIKPDVLYIPYLYDVHTDHQCVSKALHSCTKSFRYPYIKKVLAYEVVSETEFAVPVPEAAFIPNVFVDISSFFEKKLEIARLYKSELKPHPFPRSEENLRALATFRGATAGCLLAESFMLIRSTE